MCARLQLLVSDRTVLNYPNKVRLSEILWLSHISITLDDSAESSDFRLVVLLLRESLRGSRRGTFIILPVGHNSTLFLCIALLWWYESDQIQRFVVILIGEVEANTPKQEAASSPRQPADRQRAGQSRAVAAPRATWRRGPGWGGHSCPP